MVVVRRAAGAGDACSSGRAVAGVCWVARQKRGSRQRPRQAASTPRRRAGGRAPQADAPLPALSTTPDRSTSVSSMMPAGGAGMLMARQQRRQGRDGAAGRAVGSSSTCSCCCGGGSSGSGGGCGSGGTSSGPGAARPPAHPCPPCWPAPLCAWPPPPPCPRGWVCGWGRSRLHVTGGSKGVQTVGGGRQKAPTGDNVGAGDGSRPSVHAQPSSASLPAAHPAPGGCWATRQRPAGPAPARGATDEAGGSRHPSCLLP